MEPRSSHTTYMADTVYRLAARRQRLVTGLACLVLAALIGWRSFVAKQPVPLLQYVDIGFHEFGHLLFSPFPDVVHALMGDGVQTLTPLLLCLYFLVRRRDLAAAGLMLAWCSETLAYAATYIRDAPYQELPLLYPGGTHDWAFILGPAHFDALDRAGAIADGVHLAGVVLLGLGLALCLLQVVLALWPRASRGALPASPGASPEGA